MRAGLRFGFGPLRFWIPLSGGRRRRRHPSERAQRKYQQKYEAYRAEVVRVNALNAAIKADYERRLAEWQAAQAQRPSAP